MLDPSNHCPPSPKGVLRMISSFSEDVAYVHLSRDSITI